MSNFHSKKATEIIRKILYITIATTSKGGQPWNGPVYSAFDKDLHFYWSSDKDSQHSKNIRENKNVFLVIYDSTVPEGTGEGVYIQAEAHELAEKSEITVARRITQTRKGQESELTEKEYEKFTGDALRRVYKAIPRKIWVNDVETDENGKYIRDIRVEVSLGKVRALLIV